MTRNHERCEHVAADACALPSGWGRERKSLRAVAERNHRLCTDLAGSVTRGEYRPLDGARHSTLTTDRPDDVVRAVRDPHWTVLH